MSVDPRFATLSKRLLARPRPGAWLGLVIRAFPAAGEAGDGPPHWLVAGWQVDDDGLAPRLPEFAAIASPDRERALAELLVHLPPEAPFLLVTPERVDAALVAEMVLAIDAHLQPWHRAGLLAFVDAQREADRARVRARYTDREEGYERMWRTLVGGAAGDGAGPAQPGGPEAGGEGGSGGGGPEGGGSGGGEGGA
ncbi:MAG: hypothetical protein RJA99_1830 [Pseudomonadota bacterium]|jgi:hypothetical protein